jgi:hypothetical protein
MTRNRKRPALSKGRTNTTLNISKTSARTPSHPTAEASEPEAGP